MRYVEPSQDEILKLLAEGLRPREVAERLDMRASRVQAIRANARAEARRRERVEAARAELRAANDVARRWPPEKILSALDLGMREHNCLARCLREDSRAEASLKDVMDLLLPACYGLADGPVPMRRERKGLGRYTYRSIMDIVTTVDLGAACRREWTARCRGAVLRRWGPDGVRRCMARCSSWW
jgi:DNA-binding CsgD family transcriptional regulator